MPPSAYESDQKPQSKGFFSSLLDPEWFTMFPNCINLALSESLFQDEEGEEFGSIGSVRNLRRAMTVDQLLQVCTRQRGTAAARAFDANKFDSQRGILTKWARQLQLYLGAKSSMTIGAVSEVLRALREVYPQARRILIVPDDPYDWSTGIFSDEIGGNLTDEIWSRISSTVFGPGVIRRPLLSFRSCYYILSFFSMLNNCTNKQMLTLYFNNVTARSIKKRLRRSAGQAMSELPLGGDPILPQEIDRADGIIVGLDEAIIDALVASAFSEIDEGSVLL